MRYILIVMILVSNIAFADIYILYDNKTNQIISLSSADDAVCPKTQSKATIKGELSDLGLTYRPAFYKFNKGKIKLNMQIVEEEAVNEEKARKKALRKAKIKAKAEKMAEQALIASGELEAE